MLTATSLRTNHKLFSYQEVVNEICKPLFENSLIRYFNYERYYYDGKSIVLTNQPKSQCGDIIDFYYHRHNYPNLNEFQQNTQRYLILSTHLKPDGVTSSTKYENNINLFHSLGIEHRLIILEHNYVEKYHSVYMFGMDERSPESILRLATHIDSLERFIVYFKLKAQPLLKELKRHSVISLPYFREGSNLPPVQPLVKNKELNWQITQSLKDFYIEDPSNIEVHKILFSKSGSMVKLTGKEAECLQHLARGYSTKRIAQVMNLSPRTIETHLNNIKLKAGYKSLIEIVSNITTLF